MAVMAARGESKSGLFTDGCLQQSRQPHSEDYIDVWVRMTSFQSI